MNLKNILSRINNLTDYSPEIQGYQDQLFNLINDAYYQVWTHKRWNFSTKEIDFQLWTDITATTDTENSGGNSVTLTAARGSRQVTFSHDMNRLGAYTWIWEGQPIEIDEREYIISKIVSPNELLVEQPISSADATASTSWKIKKRFYDLPNDCLEMLYIGHRDAPHTGGLPVWGKAVGVMPRRDEDLNLRTDWTMDYAEGYIPSPCRDIPAGEKLTYSAGAGTLPLGFYELCYAFEKDGKVGPLSESTVCEVEEGNTGLLVQFEGYDGEVIVADFSTADDMPSQWEGYRKKLYFNYNFDRTTGERLGLPCWMEVTIGGDIRDTEVYLQPLIADDVDSTAAVKYLNQMLNGNKRYIEIDGQHQQIRFYPRPIGYDETERVPDGYTMYWRFMRMRYMKKPQDLLLPTDTPDMPYEFHQLIVYKALENLYLKLGQMSLASTWEKKFNDDVKDLQKRYVDKIDMVLQRGSFSFENQRFQYDWRSLKHNG